jgi:hypothetical protein
VTVPGIDAWNSWHPSEVANRLLSCEAPWVIAGGKAVDLFLDRHTRAHEDIEIETLRIDFNIVRHCLEDHVDFYAAGSGRLNPLAPDQNPPSSVHQVWCCGKKTRQWHLDIMLSEGTRDTWVYRRNSAITRTRSLMIGQSAAGIPFEQPVACLLYKAKYMREKDERDFSTLLPTLPLEERVWLANALNRVYPRHVWIDQIVQSKNLTI